MNLTEEQKIKYKRFWKIFGDCVFYAIMIFFAATIISFAITGRTTGKPNMLGYRHFYIASNSMEPTIRTQQLVLTKLIEPDEIEVNDIIAYKSDYFTGKNDIIIHRVVDIIKDEEGNKLYKFMGDNNEIEDPFWVTEDMIMYKVILY